jgi:tetratricopeptide (TPR) repeat protein
MKKEERHQIKRDDLATVLERAMLFVEDHRKPIITIAAVLVVAGIGAMLLRGWLRGREEEASLLVSEMMETYSLPIVESLDDLGGAPAGAERFTSAAERDRRVLEQADAILARFSSASTVPKALHYRGMALANLGRFDEAVDALDRIVRDYPGDFLAPLARYQMARVRESQGRMQEALTHFQALAVDPGGALPPEEGILGIARCHEALGDREEALRTYQRILIEFPDSEYLIDARTKVDELS